MFTIVVRYYGKPVSFKAVDLVRARHIWDTLYENGFDVMDPRP